MAFTFIGNKSAFLSAAFAAAIAASGIAGIGCGNVEQPAGAVEQSGGAAAQSSPAKQPAAGAAGKVVAAGETHAVSTPAATVQFANIEEAFDALRKALEAKNNPQIIAITNWLSRQGAAAVEPLTAQINDPNSTAEWQVTLVRALGGAGQPAVPALVEYAKQHDTREVRLKAVGFLSTIQPIGEDAISGMFAVVDDQDNQLAAMAIRGLGKAREAAKECVPKLISIMNSGRDDSVRNEAREALKKIELRRQFTDGANS